MRELKATSGEGKQLKEEYEAIERSEKGHRNI
jgi:hypothetical protein